VKRELRAKLEQPETKGDEDLSWELQSLKEHYARKKLIQTEGLNLYQNEVGGINCEEWGGKGDNKEGKGS